jgi:hypothetical protein
MLEHDSLWGMHLIPLTAWVGREARPGQGVVAFGSTHGNEYEGPVALKHLLGMIDLADVTGRVILTHVTHMPQDPSPVPPSEGNPVRHASSLRARDLRSGVVALRPEGEGSGMRVKISACVR